MSRESAAKLGAWLAAERAKRTYRGKPLSTGRLAKLANVYIAARNMPVKQILQQEISNLENATPEAGPKRPQPWWQVLRDFIEKGELDTLLAAAEGPQPDLTPEGVVINIHGVPDRRTETVVRTPDGKVVGKIVWGT